MSKIEQIIISSQKHQMQELFNINRSLKRGVELGQSLTKIIINQERIAFFKLHLKSRKPD